MYINVVFESGGIKGLAYVGAMKYFDERGYRFFRCAGTSVGAIFASLCVAGYKGNEIEVIIDNITKDDIYTLNSLKNGLKNKGIYNIDKLEKILENTLLKKGVVTFQDVKFGDDYLLKVVAYENKSRKMVVLPDDLGLYGYDKNSFKISKAVAMSCSIPLFYSEYRVNENRFVDGGLINKFPLDLIKDNKIQTFGLKLSNNKKTDKTIKKLTNCNSKDENSYCNVEIIAINTLGIKSIQFSKGLEQRKKLYLAGYNSVSQHFINKYK